MSFRRFGSWPSFNGRKVVLEDDDRLGAAVPQYVPQDGWWRMAENMQAVAAAGIKNDGTMVVSGTLVML